MTNEEQCICSTCDWSGEDMTREHHRDCPTIMESSFADCVISSKPLAYWRFDDVEESRTITGRVVQFSCNTHGVYHRAEIPNMSYQFFACPACVPPNAS